VNRSSITFFPLSKSHPSKAAKEWGKPGCFKDSGSGRAVSRRTGETNRSLSDPHPNSLGNARAGMEVA
jgi:hypothetical protein